MDHDYSCTSTQDCSEYGLVNVDCTEVVIDYTEYAENTSSETLVEMTYNGNFCLPQGQCNSNMNLKQGTIQMKVDMECSGGMDDFTIYIIIGVGVAFAAAVLVLAFIGILVVFSLYVF